MQFIDLAFVKILAAGNYSGIEVVKIAGPDKEKMMITLLYLSGITLSFYFGIHIRIIK